MANILVVDDDPDILELIRRLLVRAGHHVPTAASAEPALRVAGGDPIDLAVIDVRLPQAGGLGLAQALRSQARLRSRQVPFVIACSAYYHRSALGLLGFDGYVPKPIDAENLCGHIQSALQGRQTSGRATAHLVP